MTAILGLNVCHSDSSACLVIGGKFVWVVAEKCLRARNKHAMTFPKNAIRGLLDAGLRFPNISYVMIAGAASKSPLKRLRRFITD